MSTVGDLGSEGMDRRQEPHIAPAATPDQNFYDQLGRAIDDRLVEKLPASVPASTVVRANLEISISRRRSGGRRRRRLAWIRSPVFVSLAILGAVILALLAVIYELYIAKPLPPHFTGLLGILLGGNPVPGSDWFPLLGICAVVLLVFGTVVPVVRRRRRKRQRLSSKIEI
ncbi:MAG: hypothetical protein ACRDFX_04890 [Chloroflexota bacterium]